MDNYNYPEGTDTKNAPWNQVDNPEREIEVTVSVTLSKTVKIEVSDYTIIDQDENEEIDYSSCDLVEAVENQVYLPQEAGKLIDNFNIGTAEAKNMIEDLSNWNIDDMEVIIE